MKKVAKWGQKNCTAPHFATFPLSRKYRKRARHNPRHALFFVYSFMESMHKALPLVDDVHALGQTAQLILRGIAADEHAIGGVDRQGGTVGQVADDGGGDDVESEGLTAAAHHVADEL